MHRFGCNRRRCAESAQRLGRVLARRHDSPQHRGDQHSGAGIERVAHGIRDRRRPARDIRVIADAELCEHERQSAGDDGACADEEALHGVAGWALCRGELIADEGTEWLHRYVDRRVEYPQKPGRDIQARRTRHEKQRRRGEQRADQEVRAPPAESGPGAVREIADDRLHQESGQWRCNPECGDVVDAGSEGLEDPADVCVLQRKAELQAEKAETHIPYLPERQRRMRASAGRAAHWSAPRAAVESGGRGITRGIDAPYCCRLCPESNREPWRLATASEAAVAEATV